MKKKSLILAGAATLSLAAGCCMFDCSEKVPLTKDGKPAAKIVIAAKPAKVARFGALELQYHLKLITGMEFPIITDAEPQTGFEIRVGESKRTKAKKKDFKPQQYLIDVNPDYIELIGYDSADRRKFLYKVEGRSIKGNYLWPSSYEDQGTMYAVYEFLENYCGVTWIDPTDYGTVVTENKNLAVPVVKKRGEPFMSYRGGTFDNSYRPLLYRDNSAGTKRYNAAGYKNLRNKRQQDKLFLLRMRSGGDHAPANHSLYSYYERFLQKGHRHFESYKPLIFAQGYPGKQPPQLCYSNPETIAQVVKDVRDYFDNGGIRKRWRGYGRTGYAWGKNYFCLEPMDNSSFCLCKRCTAEYEPSRKNDKSDHSTHWFKFVNAVAKEIKKSHPDKKITTLAYASHEGLPTGFKVEDNVVVYFCISANRTPYSKLLPEQIARMEQWRKAYPDQPLAMWLYNTFPKEIATNGNFHCFPGFFAKEAVRQYQIFKKLNIRGGIFHCGFVDLVDNWMQLKLMFNPDYTADELLTQYFKPYGKAGKYVREFYETVEDRYCDKSLYAPGAGHQNLKIAWGILGTPEVMAKLDKLMAAAEKAAETEDEKARVKLWKLYVYDYMKEGFDSYQTRSKAKTPVWTFKKIASANGNAAKVNWNAIPGSKLPMYTRGSKSIWPLKDSSIIKGAYDDKYFYMELTEFVAPDRVVISPKIAAYDTWEVVVAHQQAQPYRHYMSGPDGRILGQSWGEVNWRQSVDSSESGLVNFGVKCSTDRTKKDRWVTRYAFPLATMLDKPVVPGQAFYMNLTRVTNPKLFKERRLGIYTAVSYTTVHTIDRSAKIILEK